MRHPPAVGTTKSLAASKNQSMPRSRSARKDVLIGLEVGDECRVLIGGGFRGPLQLPYLLTPHIHG